LIGYILDRNVCLLPGYLAVNEITKVCPEDKLSPHWVYNFAFIYVNVV